MKIENEKILNGITVLDFSHRLPGPLCGKILSDYGATVYKIEDHVMKDAFLSGLFANFDESFLNWYEELNQNKKLVRLDFKGANIKAEIAPYLAKADAIIMGLPPKLKLSMGLDDDSLKNSPIASIELLASKNHHQSMHDLNAMAMSGLLSLYVNDRNEKIVPPPFLPIMGIGFGAMAANQLIGLILKSKLEKKYFTTQAYLYEDCDKLFSPFWPKKDRSQGRTRFLHNGAYPCYCLYKLKDGHYAAVAPVEDKFWESFTQIFKIDIKGQNRFNTDIETFNKVANVLEQYDSEQFKKIASTHDICLSWVEKKL